MPFHLDRCTDSDMIEAFTIISESFGLEHPYINYAFPHHETPEGRVIGGERMLAIKKGDPNTTFLKVTDTDTGCIVGVAKWNIYDGVIPEEMALDGDYWSSETDKKYAQELTAGYLKPRRQAIKDEGGHLACKSNRSFKGISSILFEYEQHWTSW